MITKNKALLIAEKENPNMYCRCTYENEQGYVISMQPKNANGTNYIIPSVFVYKSNGAIENYFPPKHGGTKIER